MKKRLFVFAILLMLLAGLFAVASAANDPLKVAMELSKNSFTAPKEITVSISVTNTGESDMPGPVTLYYPNGKQVEEFGSPTLAVGTSQSWSGTWKVTQAQLEAGKLTFKIKYSVYNDEGELQGKTKNFSKAITYTGAVDQVEVNRTITPATAQKGQEVTITYDIVNAGTIDITDVVIKENSAISSKKASVGTIAAGEKAVHSFTVKMGTKNLTSEPVITYKSSGKTQTIKKEAATIKYGEINLSASLTADKKGGIIGDTVKLTLKLKNSGKSTVSGIVVRDAVLGEIFTGETVEAGSTVTLEKEIEVSQTQDYQFTVTGQDADGLDVETATGRVTVTAMDPADTINLTVNAAADKQTVYTIPGTVRFTVSVTNNSQVDVSDVKVYAVNTQLYSFPTILAGETREFVRDVSISMAGQYAFNARCKDQLGETQTFQSNIIPIGYAEPTPVPTEAPIVTPPAPVYEPDPTDDGLPPVVDTVQQVLGWIRYVFGALAGIGAVLVLIGGIRRVAKKAHDKSVYDHMEIAGRRDYSEASEESLKAAKRSRKKADPKAEEKPEEPVKETEIVPEEVPYDDTGDDQDVMRAQLNKVQRDQQPEETEAVEQETEEAVTDEQEPDEARQPEGDPLAAYHPIDTEGRFENASSYHRRRRH